MSVEKFTAIVESLTGLLDVVIWPIVILYILLRYKSKFDEFAGNLTEFTFKAAGVEATAKRKIEVAVALGAASAKSNLELGSSQENEITNEIEELIDERITARSIRKFESARVLWVDDQPQNNDYELKTLQVLGVKVDICKSTEEAIEKISRVGYNVIISDMGRPPDQKAGYTLLDKLRASGNKIPFIIYAGSNLSDHKAQAKQKGAQGSTNKAVELLNMVITAIQS